MLKPRDFQTPNAIDAGESRPERPVREAAEHSKNVRQNAEMLLSLANDAAPRRSELSLSSDDEDDETVHDQLPSVEEARMFAGRILKANSHRDLWTASRDEVPAEGDGVWVSPSSTVWNTPPPPSDMDSLSDGTAGSGKKKLGRSTPIMTRSVLRRAHRRRAVRLTYLVGFVAILVGILIGVSISAARDKSRGDAFETSVPIPAPTAPQAEAPSGNAASSAEPNQPFPTPTPTQTARTDYPASASRMPKVVEFLSIHGVSTGKSLQDPTSPQYKAALWMADTDILEYEIPATTLDKSSRFIQRYAMVVFFHALNGPEWNSQLNFLNPELDECGWFESRHVDNDELVAVGITCNEFQQIENVIMPRNNLKGSLPSELAFVETLTFIDINRNEISGGIPDDFGRLRNLVFLDLRFNRLSGILPEWIGSKLINLIMLAFSHNQITGKIPDSFSQLIQLKTLALDSNLLEGNLDVLNSLTKLEYVYLENNLFDHTLTNHFLLDAPNLYQLDLSNNFLQCDLFPFHLLQHANLEVLDLNSNALSGPIPNVFQENTHLRYLALNKNSFSGPISESLGLHMQGLHHLDISGNQLEGALPSILSWLPRLATLSVGDNNWEQGPFPLWALGMINLKELSLKNSQRTGTLPGHIPEQIRMLDVGDNGFTGTIPETMVGVKSHLKHLMLQRNELQGQIPASLTNIHIPVMLLYGNGFVGDVCGSDEPATGGGLRGSANDTTVVGSATGNITSVFIADCDKVDCPCCTHCCRDDGSADCDDDSQFYESMNGNRENNYVHSAYSFAPQILLPAEGGSSTNAKAKGT